MIIRFLSWLLWLANARMGASGHRDRAYAIKERILRRHARLVGEDFQFIERICFGCDGIGEYSAWDECHRCNGTGIYDTKWIRLERWELCGRVFHRPVGRVFSRDVTIGANIIRGVIRHEHVSDAVGDEAMLWLALLYDRGLWWQLMTSARRYAELWRPMTGLQALCWIVRHRVRAMVTRPSCLWCRERYWRFGRMSHHTCPRCEYSRARLAAANDDDDLPF